MKKLLVPTKHISSGSTPALAPSARRPYNSHSSRPFLRPLSLAASTLLLSAGFLTAQPTINSVYPPVCTDRAGDHVAFTVTATASAGTLSYNWYLSSNPTTPLSTSNSLVLANIADANAGTYYVVVTDNNGSTTSSNVILNVVDSPYLTLAPTNLIVARVGEGSQPLSATTGNTVYLDQYTPTGTYVDSIQVPDETPGNPYGTGSTLSTFGSPAILVEGAGSDAPFEAGLTLSSINQEYLDLAGYCQSYPSAGVNVSGSCWRGLATVNAFGVYNLAYTNSGLYSGGNKLMHDMATLDGTNFWTTGAAGSGTVKFVNSTVATYANGTGVPSSTGTAPNSFVSPAGGHVIQIINGPLAATGFSAVSNLVYSETGSTNLNGLYAAVGTPEPAQNGNVTFKALLYTGSSGGNNADPVDFAFSPDNRTIYIADARAFSVTNSSLSGGIQCWVSNTVGGYSYWYTIQPLTGLTNGAQNLTVDFSANTNWGTNVFGAKLYVTTFGASGNSLVKIIDNGPSSTPTTLVTAGANEALRGVRFSPAAIPPTLLTSPQSQTNFPNNNVTFTSFAVGSQPIFYQWYYNNSPIPGATNTSFTTNNVSLASSGTYSIVASNLTTSIASNSAQLLITAGMPTFATPVPSYTETQADHLALAPVVLGSQPITFQWYLGSTNNPILSQTTGVLPFNSVQTSDSGTYILMASNSFGAAFSSGVLNISASPQTLSPTNLVVARIGDGAQVLSAATGNTLYLDQYTTAGAYVNTIQIPDEATGNSYGTSSANSVGTFPALLVCGANLSPFNDAGYQAFLTRAANGQTLDFAGYCQAYPFTGTDVTTAGSPASNTWKGIGEIDGNGTYSLVYTNTGYYNGGEHQVHGVVTLDQSNYWSAGLSGSASIKWLTIYFQPQSGNGIPAVAGSTPTLGNGAGPRVVQIVDGNVLFSDAGSSPIGIYACNGLATNANAGANLIVAETNSPMDFAFSPDGNTVYIADNGPFAGATNKLGGIERWDTNAVGGGYSFSYTLGTGVGSTAGARGLTADFSAHATWGSNVVGAKLYATTADATGNRLFTITDNGSSSTATTLVNSGSTNILGGVRFGPLIAPLSIVSEPQNQAVLANGTGDATFSVTAGGNGPYFYQWETNGVAIAGATNSTLTVSTNGFPLTGYTVVVSNLTQSVTSSPAASISVIPVITFNNNGSGWSGNGNLGSGLPRFSTSNSVELTQGELQQVSSSFFNDQVYVAGFLATWTYQVVNPTASNADGMCFVIQNDPRGPNALGGNGGNLGYSGIQNSVALQFDIFTNVPGGGYNFDFNGSVGSNLSTSPVVLTNGDPINVKLEYYNDNATLTLFDTVTSNTFTATTNINIPAFVIGDNAYIGFTGADGGTVSTQVVSNFVYIPLVFMTPTFSNHLITLSWPTNVGGLTLYQNTSVSTTNWVPSTNAVSVVGGENQTSVTVSNIGNLFFGLSAP